MKDMSAMSGKDAKPVATVGASLPVTAIGAPNSGRNYPMQVDEMPAQNTVGSVSIHSSHQAPDQE